MVVYHPFCPLSPTPAIATIKNTRFIVNLLSELQMTLYTGAAAEHFVKQTRPRWPPSKQKIQKE
jgi:hypothetical protein